MPFSKFTQTEMILTERRRMDTPLLWTVWVAGVTFSLVEGDWFYLLGSTLGVAVNMLAVRRASEIYVHRMIVNIGVFVATGILAIEIGTGLALPRAMGHYLILLQLCKLFQQKRNRDYTQILALSALLMIGASMMTNEPWFAGLLAIYLILLCYTAMVFTLKRGLDTVAKARVSTDAGPLEVKRVAWNVYRFWPTRALVLRGALIVSFAVLSGLAVFLLAPRGESVAERLLIPGGSRGLRGRRGSGGITGFAETVSLGDIEGTIYESNTVLMHVSLSKPGGEFDPVERYLRGNTFDKYTESRWSRTSYQRTDTLTPEAPEKLLGSALRAKVRMESSLLPNVFSCFPTVGLEGYSGEASFGSDLSVKLRSRARSAPQVEYTAYSLARPLSPDALSYLADIRKGMEGEETSSHFFNVDARPRVSALGREWCADLLERRRERPEIKDALDLEIASRIAARLETEYSYTLDLRGVDPIADGVENFLFDMKAGHCEYFASALTVMCCSLGVRARLATGFILNEYDTDNDYYIVRGRDAHAWTEVFTPSTNWVIVDPAPATGRAMHGDVWAASIRRYWNQLEFLWYEKVIGYNAYARRRIWNAVKEWFRSSARALRASATNLLVHGVVDRALLHLAIATGIAGLIGEALLVRRWIRRSVKARKILPVPPRKIGFINKLLRILERKNLPLRSDETLHDFANRVALQGHLPRACLRELVELYYRIRWGQQIPSIKELQQAEREVAALREMLRRKS